MKVTAGKVIMGALTVLGCIVVVMYVASNDTISSLEKLPAQLNNNKIWQSTFGRFFWPPTNANPNIVGKSYDNSSPTTDNSPEL
jgi:hypothetical protein